MKSITITYDDSKVIPDNKRLLIQNSCNFEDSLLLLTSAIRACALYTIKAVEEQDPSVTSTISGDIADMINFSISNILNEIQPKEDPLASLSELCIATLENEVIHYMSEHPSSSIQDAVQSVQSTVFKRSKHPAQSKRAH